MKILISLSMPKVPSKPLYPGDIKDVETVKTRMEKLLMLAETIISKIPNEHSVASGWLGDMKRALGMIQCPHGHVSMEDTIYRLKHLAVRDASVATGKYCKTNL